MIETNLTNASCGSWPSGCPRCWPNDADGITVPDEDACWGIKLESGKSLIGCDFETEAQRLDDFLTGKLLPAGADS